MSSGSGWVWNPLVVSVIASVCTALVLFFYYKVIRSICAGFGILPLRDRVPRYLHEEANPEDPSLHSHGLDHSTAKSLPIIQFLRDEKENDLKSKNTECAVCLGEFEDGDQVKILPRCSHSFHDSCIDMWFKSQSTCPVCRTQVFEISICEDCSVSMGTPEALRTEDLVQERAAYLRNIRSLILSDNAVRIG